MSRLRTPGEFRAEPLYFFDQPTGRHQTNGARNCVSHLKLANEGVQLAASSTRGPENETSDNVDEVDERMPGDPRAADEHDTSLAGAGGLDTTSDDDDDDDDDDDGMEDDPTEVYQHAAPLLLGGLAGGVLSQCEGWDEGCVPHGLVNVPDDTWRGLAAGAPRKPDICAKQPVCNTSPSSDEATRMSEKRKTEKRHLAAVADVAASGMKRHSNPRRRKSFSTGRQARAPTTISFSISSQRSEEEGWIVQPEKPCGDEPEETPLCQWVVEHLQMATTPTKLQSDKAAELGLNKLPTLRHYGDAEMKNQRGGGKTGPVSLANGMPQIPAVKQERPTLQKLHYRINDGSSFIFYPSGHVAVCQSHAGLPCGGFYTSVFSDSDSPVVLASITAFGHGTVTHPQSGVITALWDRSGGLTCDPDGSVTEVWTWQSSPGLKEKRLVQVSHVISVRLFSGTDATLNFRSQNESVQLQLSAVSGITPPRATAEGRCTSHAAPELMHAEGRRRHGLLSENNGVPALRPVHSLEVLQLVKEIEELEEPTAPWGRGGGGGRGGRHLDRELRRLQRRVRNILGAWMERHHLATGVRCPGVGRMPEAPPRTRLEREVQSAALPSLNPPEKEGDALPDQPEEDRDGLLDLPKHLRAPADYFLNPPSKLPRARYVSRMPRKRTKEESRATQIGTPQVHSNDPLK